MPPEIAPPPAPAPNQHTVTPVPIIIAVIILIVAGLGLWYVLTRPAPAITPIGESPDAPNALGKAHITDKGPYYDIDAAYPTGTPLAESASAEADAKAVASMKAFETEAIAQFKEDTGVTSLTAEDIQVQGLSKDRYYALGIDYKTYSSLVTLSFVYLIYADTLGAHPNAYYRTFTYDANTGAELSIDDLFASSDYLAVLSNEARTRLPALLEARLGSSPDPDMLAAGTTPDAANFQTFYLEGPDLVLIFPPYQIAAYAAGTTELRIPRSALGNALKPEFR